MSLLRVGCDTRIRGWMEQLLEAPPRPVEADGRRGTRTPKGRRQLGTLEAFPSHQPQHFRVALRQLLEHRQWASAVLGEDIDAVVAYDGDRELAREPPSV